MYLSALVRFVSLNLKFCERNCGLLLQNMNMVGYRRKQGYDQAGRTIT